MKWSNEYFLIQLGIRNKGVEALEPYQGSDKKYNFVVESAIINGQQNQIIFLLDTVAHYVEAQCVYLMSNLLID